VEALVHVKYLSIRSETERALLRASAELDTKQVLLPVVAEGATPAEIAFQKDRNPSSPTPWARLSAIGPALPK
jgi:hypothetical protein